MRTLSEGAFASESCQNTHLTMIFRIQAVQARLVVCAAAQNKMANPATPENFETLGLAGRACSVADRDSGFGFLVCKRNKSTCF